MSSPAPSQEPLNYKIASPASDVNGNGVEEEIFAEDEGADDAAGLFGSDEEGEGSQYDAIPNLPIDYN